MKDRKSYSQELSDRKEKKISAEVLAIQANTAVLMDIKQILLMVADSLLDQEEEQGATQYLDGTPL